jgi:RND family efflux transporter MFP subunit
VSQSAYDQVKAAADSARALLSAAEAQLKVAQDEGAYATLVADADGTVVETVAEPGQFVSAGQIVVRLARAGAREAAVNLPETLRPALGSMAYAILYGANADSAARYPARLRQLSDAADPLTRTYEARYVLDGGAATAPLGATVTVYLKDSERSGALSVPLGAIDDEGRGPGVWLLDRRYSSVTYRSVRFIRFDGERAIVSGEIHIGDPIIAVGGHFLHEGQRIKVAEARLARE